MCLCVSLREWSYECLNMYDIFSALHPSTREFYVTSIDVVPNNRYPRDFYIDAVSIRKNDILGNTDNHGFPLTGKLLDNRSSRFFIFLSYFFNVVRHVYMHLLITHQCKQQWNTSSILPACMYACMHAYISSAMIGFRCLRLPTHEKIPQFYYKVPQIYHISPDIICTSYTYRILRDIVMKKYQKLTRKKYHD